MLFPNIKLTDIEFDKQLYKFPADKFIRLNVGIKADKYEEIKAVRIEYGYFFKSKVNIGDKHKHFEVYEKKYFFENYNFKTGEIQNILLDIPLLVPPLECDKVLVKQYIKIIVDEPFKKDLEKIYFLDNVDFDEVKKELIEVNVDLAERLKSDLMENKKFIKTFILMAI